MPHQKSSIKIYIAIAVVLIVAAIVYFYIQGRAPAPSASNLLQASGDSTDVSVQVTALFNEIQSLNIDTSLFSDPAYRTLQDFSVPIPPQNVGRVNPFAPIPGLQLHTTTGTGGH